MTVKIIVGDCRDILRTLPTESVNCVVTSPPYFGLRDYGVAGQIGLEPSPERFVDELVAVFQDVRRVLRADGTLWLNLGDSYATAGQIGRKDTTAAALARRAAQFGTGVGPGSAVPLGVSRPLIAGWKSKDMLGIPWRVAFALQADGWYLRQDIIWSKPNPMPESVTDRCTKAHEYLFLLSKGRRYHYDADAIKEPAADTGRENGRAGRTEDARARPPNSRPRTLARLDYTQIGRNKRSVWEIATGPYPEAHFATFPPALIEPCILAGCPKGGIVLDPFGGAGTTGMVADRLGRNAILIELNPDYADMAERRVRGDAGMFAEVT